MKKIFLVTRPIAPPWDEASKNFAYYLARNITGIEMHLMTKGILPELGENIIQHPIYTASQNDITFSQKIKSLVFQWRNKNTFDVTHYFFTPTKLNSFLIKTFLSSKKTKSIQTVATLREDLYSDTKIKDLMFGDLIITYSDYAAQKLNSLGFKNAKRVYPGIDLEKYSPAPKDKKIMSALNLNDADFIVSYPGEFYRLGATDDITNLVINYANELRKRKIKIIFPGRIKNEKDLAKKNEVLEILEKKGVSDLVRFSDGMKERLSSGKEAFSVARLYNTSDLIMFPVRNMHGKFDIPLAVVEAMACAKPVILSDLPILAELGKADNSVIIKAGNVPEIAVAILDLYDHPEKRERIGHAARQFVCERFDIKQVAKAYEEIYKEL